jgi:predicted metal-dependent hydrolase
MGIFNIQPGKVVVVLNMIEAENTAISSIQNDLRTLGKKVDRMEDMLETLIDIYTDTFYVVKDEYVEKLQKIRQEGNFEEFSDLESLKRSLEED